MREGIAFEEVVVPQSRSRRPEVEALTDQRRVPVLVIEGEAICDSHRILEYLQVQAPRDLGSEGGRATGHIVRFLGQAPG